MSKKIYIFHPSSGEKHDLLAGKIAELESLGWQIAYSKPDFDGNWPYIAESVSAKIKKLNSILSDKNKKIIWAARGGYGATSLLDKINWQHFTNTLVVGYSDFTAFTSTLYTQNFYSIHGPMISEQNFSFERKDIRTVLHIMDSFFAGDKLYHEIQLAENSNQKRIQGKVFGGNFAVLCSLIGTKYFPKNLAEHILILEDIGENVGRLNRYWDQLRYSGMLKGVSAIVLGQFLENDKRNMANAEKIAKFMSLDCEIPIFNTSFVGHGEINEPFANGASAIIENNVLKWEIQAHEKNIV